jgi:hydrogenase nickel incorporation protein HypA/HybF
MLMHETMVAQNLLEAILAEAAKQKGRPVGAVVSCGVLNALNNEALCFAFEAIAKGTRCEGVKLEVEQKPMQGRCENCKENFSFDFNEPRCPRCKGEKFELMPDAPIILESIEFEGG